MENISSEAILSKDGFQAILINQEAPKIVSSNEREILERQLSLAPVTGSYVALYRYTTKTDAFILAASVFCAVISGAIMPLMTIVFGQLGGSFQKFYLGTLTPPGFHNDLTHLTLYFVYLAIGEFFTSYLATVGFIYLGEHATQKLRERFLGAVLRQNMALFDNLGAGDITTTITANMDLIQTGMSEKVGLAVASIATFFTALIVGFLKNWRLSFVLLSVVFAIFFVMALFTILIVTFSSRSVEAYSPASTVAAEFFSSTRTIAAFNGQAQMAKNFDNHIVKTMHWEFRSKMAVGCMIASVVSIIYMCYGLSFWEGSRLLVSRKATLAETITVLMALMMAATSLAHVAPHAKAFTGAVSAAGKIFTVIDRPPTSSKQSTDIVLNDFQGALEFRHVRHIYPSRPDVLVLEDFNLRIAPGKVTAIVGASGSGKSSVIALLERFYDPVGGQILLDGRDISSLDLKWLRKQVALVSQESVLFNCSIRENIEHGLIGTEFEHAEREKKTELVIQASKTADAHEFIMKLPECYETLAGERGTRLSGGQKQRIAIARAIISDPKILLLDEATSALDSKSETIVQMALNKAAKGRTTVVIAHRLSTIKDADTIVVLSSARILEQGMHNELLSRKGAYHQLIQAQEVCESKPPANIRTNDSEGKSPDAEVLDGTLEPISKEMSSTPHPLLSQITALDAESDSTSLSKLIKVVWAFNIPETGLMIFGSICSILAGGGMPVQGVLFAKCIVSMSLPSDQYRNLRNDVDFWSLLYLILGIVEFLVFCGQGTAFACCSERLIYRVRTRTFRSILHQDVSFFDQNNHSAGDLTSLLSKSTQDLAGLSGATLAAILNLISTVITAMIISCIIGWKLGLVCSATIPILLFCGFSQFWVLSTLQIRAEKAYRKSASLACEAVSAIQTIAAFTLEDHILAMYSKMLNDQLARSLRSVLKTSLLYAASQSLVLLCMALGFWYGGTLVEKGEYSLFQFFVGFSCVIFAAQSAGGLFSFAPDMGKSRLAATQLKGIWDSKPKIGGSESDGERIKTLEGRIEFRDVRFSYHSRHHEVLQGVNFKVEPGQVVALVGASGCGKSTAIALLERFNDPTSGVVLVDGKNIAKLNVCDYRRNIGLVMQEPMLYSGSIRENILLGVDIPDSGDELVEEVCKKANIWEFVISLPEGLSTVVGPHGALLSGGQKQRIAIARALIGNPRILLLDEATSALDSESEKAVQQALDVASKGRTTLVVAHRLSTIRNADRILVMDQGKIIEEGAHTELITYRGKYAEMVRIQRLLGEEEKLK